MTNEYNMNNQEIPNRHEDQERRELVEERRRLDANQSKANFPGQVEQTYTEIDRDKLSQNLDEKKGGAKKRLIQGLRAAIVTTGVAAIAALGSPGIAEAEDNTQNTTMLEQGGGEDDEETALDPSPDVQPSPAANAPEAVDGDEEVEDGGPVENKIIEPSEFETDVRVLTYKETYSLYIQNAGGKLDNRWDEVQSDAIGFNLELNAFVRTADDGIEEIWTWCGLEETKSGWVREAYSIKSQDFVAGQSGYMILMLEPKGSTNPFKLADYMEDSRYQDAYIQGILKYHPELGNGTIHIIVHLGPEPYTESGYNQAAFGGLYSFITHEDSYGQPTNNYLLDNIGQSTPPEAPIVSLVAVGDFTDASANFFATFMAIQTMYEEASPSAWDNARKMVSTSASNLREVDPNFTPTYPTLSAPGSN